LNWYLQEGGVGTKEGGGPYWYKIGVTIGGRAWAMGKRVKLKSKVNPEKKACTTVELAWNRGGGWSRR